MRSSILTTALSFSLLHSASANPHRARVFRDLLPRSYVSNDTPQSPDSLHNSALPRLSLTQRAHSTIVPEYVELPVDHFGNGSVNGSATFWNRYWVDDEFYQEGGPVFIYDVGELDGDNKWEYFLTNETSYLRKLEKKYGGIGIVWEHRPSKKVIGKITGWTNSWRWIAADRPCPDGNSTPVTISQETPPEAYEYLNTEQSLADFNDFGHLFGRLGINASLSPDAVPWVMTGGSYPGMRAAFLRNQYPDTVYAAFASSAPVEASVDMSFYWDIIPKAFRKFGYGNCTEDIHAATLYIDDLLSNSTAAAALKVRFLGLGADKNSNPTFADALNTIYWFWQGYGMGTSSSNVFALKDFCDHIETDPNTNETAPAEGWAKTKGAEYIVDRWIDYPKFLDATNYFLDTNCTGSQTEVAPDCDLNKPFTDPQTIAWTWQYCTQWGYYQYYNSGPDQIISKYNDLDHQIDICHRQFPNAPEDLFPHVPDTNKTNALFGGWTIRPSNTYWSGGEFDPWRSLSPLSDEPFAPKVNATVSIPSCGVSTAEDTIFGYVMPGVEHEFDITAKGNPDVYGKSLDLFDEALEKWLKCFTPKSQQS